MGSSITGRAELTGTLWNIVDRPSDPRRNDRESAGKCFVDGIVGGAVDQGHNHDVGLLVEAAQGFTGEASMPADAIIERHSEMTGVSAKFKGGDAIERR